jgi:hypothetical protein
MAHHPTRVSPPLLLAGGAVSALLAGCTPIQMEPERDVLRPTWRSTAHCDVHLHRAHSALASITDSTVHIAHTEHAMALHEYQACLAAPSEP